MSLCLLCLWFQGGSRCHGYSQTTPRPFLIAGQGGRIRVEGSILSLSNCGFIDMFGQAAFSELHHPHLYDGAVIPTWHQSKCSVQYIIFVLFLKDKGEMIPKCEQWL